jgi:ABC-type nitrate/sulfonate/bicarbonate transport system permease component
MTTATATAPSPPRTPRSRRRGWAAFSDSRSGLVLTRVLIIAALAAVAELVVRLDVLPSTFIAEPTEVVRSLHEEFVDGAFLPALRATAGEVVVALGLAAVLGLTTGYLFWRVRLLSAALLPFVNALFSSPIVLLYPVSLVLFGRSHTAIVVQATVYATLPIIVYTARALSEVPPVLHKVCDVNCLSGWRRLWFVMIPSAAPKLATGLRLGVTYVMISVVSVEFLVQIGGLGQSIQLSALRFDMPGVYAYVVAVVVLASLVISALHALERRVQR